MTHYRMALFTMFWHCHHVLVCRHLVLALLTVFSSAGTVFAYGATGAGKTYTMSGLEQKATTVPAAGDRPRGLGSRNVHTTATDDDTCRDSEDSRASDGLIPRSMRHIFHLLSNLPADVRMHVRASYYEIYNELVYDLLAQRERRPLQVSLWRQLRSDSLRSILVSGQRTRIIVSVGMCVVSREDFDVQTYPSKSKCFHILPWEIPNEKSTSYDALATFHVVLYSLASCTTAS